MPVSKLLLTIDCFWPKEYTCNASCPTWHCLQVSWLPSQLPPCLVQQALTEPQLHLQLLQQLFPSLPCMQH